MGSDEEIVQKAVVRHAREFDVDLQGEGKQASASINAVYLISVCINREKTTVRNPSKISVWGAHSGK